MSATTGLHLLHLLHPPRRRIELCVDPGVVHVRGAIDTSTAAVFSSALVHCDDDTCVQALDLSAVEFFGAVGAWCFVDHGWPHRPHVRIIASRLVRRVLTICDMEFLLAPYGWRRMLDDPDADPLPESIG